ncbi:MAG TPA: hypothetical protein VL171_02405 [Verrucomicrobiae bacterium]|nr:hypothetical protein [Verrucomicrobiae bacterium]
MNEIKVSVSRETASARQPLPLFRFNRRFVICCALAVASLQLALADLAPQRSRVFPAPVVPRATSFSGAATRSVIVPEPWIVDWQARQIVNPPEENDARYHKEQFESENGPVQRASAFDENPERPLPGPWAALPHGVRFSPELGLASGKPYIGVSIVIPLGN